MFLTDSSNKAGRETALLMHQKGIKKETPVAGLPDGFFIGTTPFLEVEAVDGRQVMPLNRYTFDGTIYFFYQRMD